jgi:formylglycine-generating enzyme required for sulfatase activity
MNLQHAKKFCAWLGGRVPTPEEWEYVAKSGTSRIFPWANGTPTATLASFQRKEHPDGSGPIGSHPTGNTPWGIKDMAGSIAEWTQEQPTGQAQLRGGSWQSRMPMFLRTSYRQLESDDFQDSTTGIRCVQ